MLPGGPLGRALVRLWPWVSLAMGVASAALMDRRPERGWLVVSAIAFSWSAALVARPLLLRFEQRLGGRGAPHVRLAHFGSTLAAVGPVQFVLFFTLPFYWRARAGTGAQLAFVALLGLAAAITLWDPLLGTVARRPIAGALLRAVATFAGVNALLPILGFSNRASLTAASVASSLLWGLGALVQSEPGSRRRVLVTVVPASLALGLASALPLARRAIPAAPLRLVQAAIGTEVRDWTLLDPTRRFSGVPSKLACFSLVWAPRGVRDALVHVWTRDGVEMDRIPLNIRGGGAWGFSTWSIKHNLGANPAGTWTCSVETTSGQVLGQETAVVVASPRPDERPVAPAPSEPAAAPAAAVSEPPTAPDAVPSEPPATAAAAVSVPDAGARADGTAAPPPVITPGTVVPAGADSTAADPASPRPATP
jgi:hypothetical protein